MTQIDIGQDWTMHAPHNVANFGNLFQRGVVEPVEED